MTARIKLELIGLKSQDEVSPVPYWLLFQLQSKRCFDAAMAMRTAAVCTQPYPQKRSRIRFCNRSLEFDLVTLLP